MTPTLTPANNNSTDLIDALQGNMFALKADIIHWATFQNNTDVIDWSKLWESEDKIIPSIPCPETRDNVYHESEFEGNKLNSVLVGVAHLTEAQNAYSEGRFEDALYWLLCLVKHLYYSKGVDAQFEAEKQNKAENRHQKTTIIKRIVIETYIKMGFKTETNDEIAESLLNSEEIEKFGYKAPSHKTVVNYISLIKRLLRLTDACNSMKYTDTVTTLIICFVESDLSTAKSRNECLQEAKASIENNSNTYT